MNFFQKFSNISRIYIFKTKTSKISNNISCHVTKIHTPKNHSTKESFFKKIKCYQTKIKVSMWGKRFLFLGILVMFREKYEVMTKYSLFIFSILAKFCTKTCWSQKGFSIKWQYVFIFCLNNKKNGFKNSTKQILKSKCVENFSKKISHNLETFFPKKEAL
jgi:hypothetical protein